LFFQRASRLRTADIDDATPSALRTEGCELQIADDSRSDRMVKDASDRECSIAWTGTTASASVSLQCRKNYGIARWTIRLAFQPRPGLLIQIPERHRASEPLAIDEDGRRRVELQGIEEKNSDRP